MRWLLATILYAAMSLVAHAATISVELTGADAAGCGVIPNPSCRTIGYAVNSRAQAGDTVQVGAGTFQERVVIGRSGLSGQPITIQGTRGSGGEWLTIVDGSVQVPSTGWTRWSSDSENVRYLTWYHADLESLIGGSEPWAMVTAGYEKIPKAWNTSEYPASLVLEISPTEDWPEDGYDTLADGFEGFGAFFAYMNGNTYVRFRDGDNPGTVGVRVAPGGGVFDIGSQDYINVKDFRVIGGQFGFRIASGTFNRIEGNKITNGYARIKFEGSGTSNNTIVGNTMYADHIGDHLHGAYMGGFDGHPTLGYRMAIDFHIRDLYKQELALGEESSPSGDADIRITGDGGNNKILGNDIYDGQAGVSMDGQNDIEIAGNYIHNVQVGFGGGDNLRGYVHDNIFYDMNWMSRMNDPDPPLEFYIYRNKVYSPAGMCAVWWSSEGIGGADIWVYHNTCVVDDGGDYGWGENSSALNFGWGSGPIEITGYFINNIFSTLDMTEGYSPGFLEAYDYNISANGDIPEGDSSDGIGTHNIVLSSGNYVWEPSTDALDSNFVPPSGIEWEERGIDVSQPFSLVSGGPYDPLPGYAPGTPGAVSLPYFDGAAPDLGAVQSQTPGENIPPTVTMTSPPNGAVYTEPASILVAANASDPDGTIAGVEFKQNGLSLGIDNTSPFEVAVQDVMAGAYTFLAIATDNLGATTTSSPVSITVNTGQVVTAFRINAAGSVVDPFVADIYYAGGLTISRTASVNTSAPDSAPQAVYQTERYGNSANPSYPDRFVYTIPSGTPGSQKTVRLHFNEGYFSAINRRQFDVVINGALVLDNFDVYAAAGGQNIAINRLFTTTANAQGNVIVEFNDGPYNHPMVNGIEVIGEDVTNNAPTVSITTPTPGAQLSGTALLSGTSADDVSVVSVEVQIDGGAFQLATGTTNWSFSLDTTTLLDGSHTLTVRSTDGGGLQGTASVPFSVLNAGAYDVLLYEMVEETMTNGTSFSNPFADTELRLAVSAPTGRPLGESFTWYGFHDGNGAGGQTGNVWKFRMLFDYPGTWTVNAGFYVPGTQTQNGPTGQYSYTVSPEKSPGQHGHVVINPTTLRFRYADGTPFTPFVARTSNLIGTDIVLATQWMDEHVARGVNIFGIAYKHDDTPHFLDTDGSRTDSCDTSLDYTRMDIATWTQNDQIIQAAKDRGVMLHVWNGISGINTQNCGYGPQDFIADNTQLGPNQVRFARYFLARWAPFTNWWHWTVDYEYQETGTSATTKNRTYGTALQSMNPWKTIITTHPTGGDAGNWQLGSGPEFNLATLQRRVSESNPVSSARQYIEDNDGYGKPVYNSEGVWTSDDSDRRLETEEVRLAFGSTVMAGGYAMYSSDWPSEGSSEDCGDDESRNAIWACVSGSSYYLNDIGVVGAFNQFFSTVIDISDMVPSHSIVSLSGGNTVMALAKTGQKYLVWVNDGGTPTINLSGIPGTFSVTRYRASALSSPTVLPNISGGASRSLGASPTSDDYFWVVSAL